MACGDTTRWHAGHTGPCRAVPVRPVAHLYSQSQLRPKSSPHNLHSESATTTTMEAFFRRPLVWLPARTVTVDGTLSAATGEPKDGEDRISALPDDLRRNPEHRLPPPRQGRRAHNRARHPLAPRLAFYAARHLRLAPRPRRRAGARCCHRPRPLRPGTQADTKVSPRTMLPSVKILALKVNLGVFKEVQMLFSFIRCFPNIETLHVESARVDEPTGKDYAEFFRELSPIECVQSHIKMVVLHEIYGDLSEVMFIKYITQRANELKKLTLVLSDKRRATVGEMMYVVKILAIPQWASETCMVLLMAPKEEEGLDFHRASDLNVKDPFLEYGQELFRFIKKGE
ncbi:hypothetical protein BDA96_03G225400 [Sorghum bicolor]|uniref:FBD domain-containing protein n=1 Tax=Sorghum bicolor TaxID=4558 RepID=A0A921UN38_SORBI|nr:hypothetical protein BDA96_03G225400 [Sorghum bicolor]